MAPDVFGLYQRIRNAMIPVSIRMNKASPQAENGYPRWKEYAVLKVMAINSSRTPQKLSPTELLAFEILMTCGILTRVDPIIIPIPMNLLTEDLIHCSSVKLKSTRKVWQQAWGSSWEQAATGSDIVAMTDDTWEEISMVMADDQCQSRFFFK